MGISGYNQRMRKKLIAAATAIALTVPAVQAPHAQAQTEGSSAEQNFKDIGQGIENAFDPESSSDMDTPKGFFGKLIEPYKLGSSEAFKPHNGSSMNLEASSQGITQAIINYLIIAVGVTLVGQIIQLAMSNLKK